MIMAGMMKRSRPIDPNAPVREGRGFAPLVRALLLGLIPVLAFCVVSYLWFDQPVALWFKANLVGTWSLVFHRLTDLGLGGVWLIPAFCGAFYFRRAEFSAKTVQSERRLHLAANGSILLFASVAGSGLVVDLLKGLIGRLRPYELFQHGLYGFEPLTLNWAKNSFPSGHGQTAFAALTVFAAVWPRFRIPFLLLALLVAASRVIISVHYLSDVVMGAYCGFAGTALLVRLFELRGWDLRDAD